MSDLLPFFLYEANLSLYPVDADGGPLLDSPLWWGAVANNLRLTKEYEEVLMASSAERYQTAHHVDERHAIEVDRTWILRKSAVGDFTPQRNQRYALQIVWESDGAWYQRLYYGVTGRTVGWDSRGTLQFGNRQSYRAQYYEERGDWVPPRVFIPSPGGGGVVTPPPIITTPLPPDEQSIGFFRENPMVAGEYLLGHYRWARDVKLNGVKLVAFAPQGAPNVLTLEIAGALQFGKALTIPVGPANTEVIATVDLAGLLVRAGQSVRWRITEGPAPENASWVAALVMQVQPL